MFDRPKLLTPGPVEVPSAVLDRLSQHPIHHRTDQFESTFKRVQDQLKMLFQTKQNVAVFTASGTGAMEAAVVNFFSTNEKVIVVESGKFGQRFSEIARIYGLNVISIEIPWGESLDTGTIKSFANQHPDAKGFFTQGCETSTGALHEINGLKKLLPPDCLLIVDAISSMGASDLKMDQWGVDVVIAGSQKAFMMPTGLSFLAASELACKKAQSSDLPKFYFDFLKTIDAGLKNSTPFSSAVNLILALDQALQLMLENGLDQFRDDIQNKAFTFRKALDFVGLKTLPSSPSPSLSVILVPEEVNGKALRQMAEDKYNITFMGGQEQLAGKIVRIGHLGAINLQDLKSGFLALCHCLKELGHPLDDEKVIQAANLIN